MHKMQKLDDPKAFMQELMRRDFAAFLRKAAPFVIENDLESNWHLEAIAHRLYRIERGEERRLLVTLPPRNLKSITISIAWVAWMLGRYPERNFMCASYSIEVGSKLARQCLSIMQSKWYRELFPGTVIKRSRSAAYDFETTRGGGRLTTSVGGSTTGRGGDILIIDDPIKPDEAHSTTTRDKVNDWYRSTLTSRLNDKRIGVIINVMQRLHADDLAGQMIEDGGWDHLNLPAIAQCDEIVPLMRGRTHRRCEGEPLDAVREPLTQLAQIKREQGSMNFAAQYLQKPEPAEGNVVEAKWLRTYDPATLDLSYGQIVQSMDTASKDNPHNDYSVCVTALVVGKSIYIIDVFRDRLKIPALKAKTIELSRLHQSSVLLIEDAASGTGLIQSLFADEPPGVPSPIPRRPEVDKVSRLMGVSAMIEAGRMFLPSEAHWLAEYRSELLGFPAARHDDQVDATSQLLAWVQEKDMFRTPIIAGPELVTFDDGWGDDTASSYSEYDAGNDLGIECFCGS